MRLQQMASNLTRVMLGNSVSFYFSYETIIGFNDNGRVVITDKRYSNITQKHKGKIREFEQAPPPVVVDESEFNAQLCKLQEKLRV